MGKRRIKIAHIVEGFTGGLNTYMRLVLPQLAQKGFDTTLICSLNRASPDAADHLTILRSSNVTVHIVPMHREIRPLKDIRAFVLILKLMLTYKFDIVHTHCSKAGALGRVAAVFAGIKIRLHSSHCFAFARCANVFFRRLYRFLEQVLGRITTRYIAVAQSDASTARKSHIVPESKCIIVNNGLPLINHTRESPDSVKQYIKASLGLRPDGHIVMTACRLVAYKGITRFLETAMFSNCPNITFLIAGEGPLRPFAEEFIKAHNLDHKIKLLGHIRQMEQLYRISDVVVLCSDAEAQPYLILEAMRAGCTIIATNVAGNKELLSEERGILVEPAPQALALAIKSLLADEDRRNLYAKKAYNYFRMRHTLEVQISKLSDVYMTCIEETQ